MASPKHIALVTGANRGIGFETCRQLANEGLRVILTSRDPEAGEEATANLHSKGFPVEYRRLDVTNRNHIISLSNVVESKYGRLDVLINNAGVYLDRGVSVFEVDEEVVRTTLEINFYGAFRLCRAFVPGMVERGYGRVVNLTSGYGEFERMGGRLAGYKVSKAALNALTRVVAGEVHGNVKVNAVDPGWVRTAMGGEDATRSVEEAAADVVWAATLHDDAPNGVLLARRTVRAWR